MIRVALNVGALAAPRTGIGRYVSELALGLPRQCELRGFQGLTWRLPSPHGEFALPEQSAPQSAWRRLLPVLPGTRSLARCARQAAFAAAVRRWRPQVYHEPCYLALSFDGPTVVTAHDASWVRYPEAHPRARVRQMERLFPASLERADRVIVDSEFAATEMRDLFGVPPEKLRVVPLGVDPVFRPGCDADTAAARVRLGLAHGAYVLTVGTLEPRKNLATLLAAYEAMPAELGRRYPLVIAGMPGWGDAGLDTRRIERLRRRGCLKLAGFVPENELPGLYAGAALFVYPSLYEGFGLPPLEAMACGVPVVIADCSALPEVVGSAGRYFAALDADALARQIESLLENPLERQQLGVAGRQRAAGFGWPACVRQTVAVYAELLP